MTHPHPRPARSWYRWTPVERSRLDEIVSRGGTYQEAAQALRRPLHGVYEQCKQYNMRYHQTIDAISQDGLAALLGISESIIRTAVRRGWLRRAGPRFLPYVMDDVRAFLATIDGWVLWSPDTITDPDLRRYAADLRARGPRWLTVKEAAAIRGYSSKTVSDWCRNGRLAAVKVKIYYIRSDVLAAFVPPWEVRP